MVEIVPRKGTFVKEISRRDIEEHFPVRSVLEGLAAKEAYHFLGTPEGELALAQAVVYLACAAKSNAVYAAFNTVKGEIGRTGSLEVPVHLRNAPTRLMKELGYGKA